MKLPEITDEQSGGSLMSAGTRAAMLNPETAKGGVMETPLVRERARIIFVANAACGKPPLCAQVRAHAENGADVLVVAPLAGSTLDRWTSDDAEDRAAAEARLRASVKCLRRHGVNAKGVVGDADPVQAVADALHDFPADEIVICLEGPEREHWFRRGIVARTRERFGLPVAAVDVHAGRPAAVAMAAQCRSWL